MFPVTSAKVSILYDTRWRRVTNRILRKSIFWKWEFYISILYDNVLPAYHKAHNPWAVNDCQPTELETNTCLLYREFFLVLVKKLVLGSVVLHKVHNLFFVKQDKGIIYMCWTGNEWRGNGRARFKVGLRTVSGFAWRDKRIISSSSYNYKFVSLAYVPTYLLAWANLNYLYEILSLIDYLLSRLQQLWLRLVHLMNWLVKTRFRVIMSKCHVKFTTRSNSC
jgi:hypothetical protein